VVSKSLRDLGLFGGGCSQEWYANMWQRMSGCGPSVVTNMLGYMRGARERRGYSRDEWVALMEDVWQDVTPAFGGIPTTEALTTRADKYIARCALPVVTRELPVPGTRDARPGFDAVLAFIESALDANLAVAFLALDNGDEEALDEWHWITLVSVEYETAETGVRAGVVDAGELFYVDIYKWYATTKKGGGFVFIAEQ
jgi:hypothetical protein